MSELISAARARAIEYLEHEKRTEELVPSVKETLSEDQMEEVRQGIFKEILNLIEGIINDLKKDNWEIEVNVVHGSGFMELIFKEDGSKAFDVVYTINQHGEDQKDGIQPKLSFDLEDVRFNVTITSSVNERIFGGISSYRGVLRVTKEEIVNKFLDRHLINILR